MPSLLRLPIIVLDPILLLISIVTSSRISALCSIVTTWPMSTFLPIWANGLITDVEPIFAPAAIFVFASMVTRSPMSTDSWTDAVGSLLTPYAASPMVNHICNYKYIATIKVKNNRRTVLLLYICLPTKTRLTKSKRITFSSCSYKLRLLRFNGHYLFI